MTLEASISETKIDGFHEWWVLKKMEHLSTIPSTSHVFPDGYGSHFGPQEPYGSTWRIAPSG
jgi:hypothetical protein